MDTAGSYEGNAMRIRLNNMSTQGTCWVEIHTQNKLHAYYKMSPVQNFHVDFWDIFSLKQTQKISQLSYCWYRWKLHTCNYLIALGPEKKHSCTYSQNVLNYLQVTRDVGTCQDSSCRGEENGKHAKERCILSSPVGQEVLGKYITCKAKLAPTNEPIHLPHI